MKLIVIGLALVLATPLSGQGLRVVIPETGAAARGRVMAALAAEGLPIGTVAACDCLVSTSPFQPKISMLETVMYAQIDVTILPDSAGSAVLIAGKRSDDGAYVVSRNTATTEVVRFEKPNRRDKVIVALAQRVADRLAPPQP